MAHRLAASHEADRELAKDLTQDILVALWRAWPSFKGQCSEHTYVARIAHHRIVTHIARFAARPSHTDLSEELHCKDPTPEELSIQIDARQALVRAIRKLPLAYREVAVLLLEGLTVTEVADTLGLTQNAVSIRSVRAKQMLRTMLKESR
jgi:RNA polymerase sigma-70 factor (ECF subfamily)